jgi:hypothetical protein
LHRDGIIQLGDERFSNHEQPDFPRVCILAVIWKKRGPPFSSSSSISRRVFEDEDEDEKESKTVSSTPCARQI